MSALSRLHLVTASLLALPLAGACSQALPPPAPVVEAAPAPAPPCPEAPVAQRAPPRESVVDYWLVVARPAEPRAADASLRGVTGTVFEELGEDRYALALYDKVTLRTASDSVAEAEGGRSVVRHSRDRSDVRLATGGELKMQHAQLPETPIVLGRTTIRAPRGTPLADDEDRERMLTLVVLARERAR